MTYFFHIFKTENLCHLNSIFCHNKINYFSITYQIGISMKRIGRVHCAKSVANSNFFDMGQHFPTFHHCLGRGEPASQFCHRLTESNLACLPSSRLKNGPKVGDGFLS